MRQQLFAMELHVSREGVLVESTDTHNTELSLFRYSHSGYRVRFSVLLTGALKRFPDGPQLRIGRWPHTSSTKAERADGEGYVLEVSVPAPRVRLPSGVLGDAM